MSTQVVTRFAPSPTGFLHIGGARTALFNWLYARHRGGKMRLRIEDTDRQRSTEEAIDAILNSLNWLGIDWDDDTVHQFARIERHREVVEQLLADGKAYRCYATPEELEDMRARARAEGRSAAYDGLWRDRDPADAPNGVEPAIRIKTPLSGETDIEDKVQGTVKFANQDFDDFIIMRSDGTPTYMLAVVVDDHDMGVTHIIRGDDHLTNTARQKFIFDALAWPMPIVAHIPLIHGPDGAKLSKRHGAVGADTYRADGYLPEAMRNYLVRLGWSHGDDEIMSTDQMIAWFDFDGIGRSPSRFDFNKLDNLNAHYLKALGDDELANLFFQELPHLKGGQAFSAALTPVRRAAFIKALPALKGRAKTLVQIIDLAGFIIADRPLVPDEKAASQLTDDIRPLLAALHTGLSSLTDWSQDAVEQCVRGVAEQQGLKFGKVAQPLRAALTGTGTSPGIFDVLMILGRDESLARIQDQAGAR